MKFVVNTYTLLSVLALAALVTTAQNASTDLKAQDVRTDTVVAAEFENRVKEYTQRREAIEARLPRIPKQATAKQIDVHKKAFLRRVLAARKGGRRGQIFTPEAESLIRKIVTVQYPARSREELRKELAEAENKTVAVKVNALYPEAAERLEMPPTLLLTLPQLPKQVRYRFVGTSLLIVDREIHLIVDFMTNALP
ncbi:MAG: hypothetical protein H0U23_16550 [Blastocatellia bacterium]|nr:hypothetical protein [Blastocatellia bacterium]